MADTLRGSRRKTPAQTGSGDWPFGVSTGEGTVPFTSALSAAGRRVGGKSEVRLMRFFRRLAWRLAIEGVLLSVGDGSSSPHAAS